METTILVIDREGWYLEQLGRMLTWGGYRGTVCLPEADAPARLAELRPRLVLLGIYPDEGERRWETLRRLRAAASTADTPLILCSSDPDLWHQALRSDLTRGCTFLRKPFQIDLVLSEVRAQLSGLGVRVLGTPDAPAPCDVS